MPWDMWRFFVYALRCFRPSASTTAEYRQMLMFRKCSGCSIIFCRNGGVKFSMKTLQYVGHAERSEL